MHIIFGHVSSWLVPLLRILKYFKFKVYYIYIDEKSAIKKNKLAEKLKGFKIVPLPLEFGKKFSLKASYSNVDSDPHEYSYKKNIELVPDLILDKYCSLFKVNKKKIRLIIQDFIAVQQRRISGLISIWSGIYPSEKIIYISFKFKCHFKI